jgi:ferredoxin-fold anticodon binding domain-containing protein
LLGIIVVPATDDKANTVIYRVFIFHREAHRNRYIFEELVRVFKGVTVM